MKLFIVLPEVKIVEAKGVGRGGRGGGGSAPNNIGGGGATYSTICPPPIIHPQFPLNVYVKR